MSIPDSTVNDSMINFSTSFIKFKNIETDSSSQMQKDIENLFSALISCKNSLNFTNSHHLPIALKLTEVLTSEELQDNDLLKELISKTTLLAWELVIFKFVKEGRHIYEKTYDQVSQSIQYTLSTLPIKEFQTKFYLKCLQALLTIPERGAGTLKTDAKQILVPLAVASLQIGLSGASPLAALSALALPIVEIVKIVSKKIQVKWYKPIWDLNWSFSGNQVNDLDKLKEFASSIPANKISSKTLFYAANLYFDMLNNSKIEAHIRQKIFNTEFINPNFIALTTKYEITKTKENGPKKLQYSKDKYWQTRFVAIKYLAKLSKSELFKEESLKQIFLLLRTEKNNNILQYLVSEINNLGSDDETMKIILKSVESITLSRPIECLESEKKNIINGMSPLQKEAAGMIGVLNRGIIKLTTLKNQKIQQKNAGIGRNESSIESSFEELDVKINKKQQLLNSMQDFQKALPTNNSDIIMKNLNDEIIAFFNDVEQEGLIKEANFLANHMHKLQDLKNINLRIDILKNLNPDIIARMDHPITI